MHLVQTQLSFEAAHRLYGVDTYSRECRANVHGHSYKVIVKASRSRLNDAGMVVDFKLFKKVCKETIEDKYDHTIILRSIDPLVKAFQEDGSALNIVAGSPTAEWMAEHFYNELTNAFSEVDKAIRIEEVCVQETENNIATYISSASMEVEEQNEVFSPPLLSRPLKIQEMSPL